ncbi:MAG: hypothetical protein ACD_2C00239G0005 [uncultured bacterium (gcode 4)]|uniref:Uncharacterized protein n=1 Tax=uncultured bacterium (gcode 4) TaxID=1234023 RepID=K2G1I4_9BACT|nr:MAG: hypothetical protein ACD_2C00239G0005 [uncultured bacterium (gcode 4)]
MYEKPFYIKDPVWNNAFGQPSRTWRHLFVPGLLKGGFIDLKIWGEIVFEEIIDDEIKGFRGLENFLETEYKGIPTYISDNHNHAFYFWSLAMKMWLIWSWATLIHIDEHSDMREPETYLDQKDFSDMGKVFGYTNNVLNVWNYIKPAIRAWILNNLYNIQSEWGLDNMWAEFDLINWDIILNLDLDFFSEEMEYIDYWKKKDLIRRIAEKSKLITISTSPFFIDQERAIRVCMDIFAP